MGIYALAYPLLSANEAELSVAKPQKDLSISIHHLAFVVSITMGVHDKGAVEW